MPQRNVYSAISKLTIRFIPLLAIVALLVPAPAPAGPPLPTLQADDKVGGGQVRVPANTIVKVRVWWSEPKVAELDRDYEVWVRRDTDPASDSWIYSSKNEDGSFSKSFQATQDMTLNVIFRVRNAPTITTSVDSVPLIIENSTVGHVFAFKTKGSSTNRSFTTPVGIIMTFEPVN